MKTAVFPLANIHRRVRIGESWEKEFSPRPLRPYRIYSSIAYEAVKLWPFVFHL